MASVMIHRCLNFSFPQGDKLQHPRMHRLSQVSASSLLCKTFKVSPGPPHRSVYLLLDKDLRYCRPCNRKRCVVSAGLSSFTKPQSRIESDNLPSEVRERTMRAVDDLGGRVTVGDVSSRAGLKISEAETALQAIATDSGGFLEVSAEGDVLYVFSKDYRAVLATKSIKLKLEPVLTKLKAVGDYLIRVSFGTTLLVSIILVYSTIIVLLSSSRSDDGDRPRGRSQNYGFSVYVSPSDLFWYLDPYYYRRRGFGQGKLNFFESVFSFVFGDGDPNEGKEEIRWKMIGEYIRSKGGVVCAEELSPFLDVQPIEESPDVESLMLPVLLRFDGEPEVDKQGNILYRFPSLQKTASRLSFLTNKSETDQFSENPWEFSKADGMNRFLVVGLGLINLFGVIVLSSWLRDATIVQRFGDGLVPFVAKILPILQLYTSSFFAIPAVRWFLLQRRNAEIIKKNVARGQWKQLLQRPDFNLQKKLSSARNLAKQTVISRDQIIYSTEKDLAEQNLEARDWEQRFRESR